MPGWIGSVGFLEVVSGRRFHGTRNALTRTVRSQWADGVGTPDQSRKLSRACRDQTKRFKCAEDANEICEINRVATVSNLATHKGLYHAERGSFVAGDG